MTKTKIEWSQEVWNPVTGCTKVSAGCKNCYAERIANRFWWQYEVPDGITTNVEYGDGGAVEIPAGTQLYRPRKFTDVLCHPERLNDPLHWRKPRRVFVNSMSDLFHEDVPSSFLYDMFNVMAFDARQHTYQVLTKRPERMADFLSGNSEYATPNIWLGVSVEDQKSADERIPWLLRTPAAVRFVSYEPALGPVYLHFDKPIMVHGGMEFKVKNLDWVIAGCETGPNARPANIDWFRSVRDQCRAANIPFFLKQMEMYGKLVKMPSLDGIVWNLYPGEKPNV